MNLYENVEDDQQRNIDYSRKIKSTARLSQTFGTLCQSLRLTSRLSDKILNGGRLMGHFGPVPSYLLMSAPATGE